MYSLLKTALTSVSRSIARSSAWRTRTSPSVLLFGPLFTFIGIVWYPSSGTPTTLSRLSPRISGKSVGEARSIMCRSPERRLARRAVESRIGTNSTRSMWMLALSQ